MRVINLLQFQVDYSYSPARWLVQCRVLNGGLWTSTKGRKGLTLNLEYSGGHPCSSCHRYDEHFHVPNGEACGTMSTSM